MDRRERFDATDLYVVITESHCAGRTALDVLDAVLDAGVRLIQMREKERTSRELYDLALEYRRRTRAHGAVLIVNDRVDLALATEADGVHLGQNDMPLAAARAIAPNLILGASTHSLGQALGAQAEGADYVNIGPIFATQTKTTHVDALGPEAIDEIAPDLSIPFSCMGGIKSHNIDEVLSRGARHPAVVTAVTAAEDVREAAEQLRERVLSFR